MATSLGRHGVTFRVLALLSITAGTAVSSPAINAHVVAAQRMPSGAMRFAGVEGGWRPASQGILPSTNRFKVGWVDTSRVFAKMVNLLEMPKVPDKVLVGPSMSQRKSAALSGLKSSVATTTESAGPVPTSRSRVLEDVSPETFDGRSAHAENIH